MGKVRKTEANYTLTAVASCIVGLFISQLPYSLFFIILWLLVNIFVGVFLTFKRRILNTDTTEFLEGFTKGDEGFGVLTAKYKRAVFIMLGGMSSLIGDTEFSSRGKMFTATSFTFCLKMSVIYPFLLFLVGWLIGGTGEVGNIEFLNGFNRVGTIKYITFIMLVTVFLAYSARFFKSLKNKFLSWSGTAIVLICLLLFYIIFVMGLSSVLYENNGLELMPVAAVLFCVGFLSFGYIARFNNNFFLPAVFLPIYFALSVLIAVPFVGRFPALFLGFIFFKTDVWDRRSLGWLYAILIALVILFPPLFVISIDEPNDKIFFFAKQYEGHIGAAFIVLFLGFLPIVNAFVDWVSINVTRKILFKISTQNLTLKAIFTWLSIDIIIAFVLCVGVFYSIILFADFVEFHNAQNQIVDEGVVFNASLLKNQILSIPFEKDNLWILAIVVTGLVPSLLSMMSVAVASLFSVELYREKIIRELTVLTGYGDSKRLVKSRQSMLTAISFIMALSMVAALLLCASLLFGIGTIFYTVWGLLFY